MRAVSTIRRANSVIFTMALAAIPCIARAQQADEPSVTVPGAEAPPAAAQPAAPAPPPPAASPPPAGAPPGYAPPPGYYYPPPGYAPPGYAPPPGYYYPPPPGYAAAPQPPVGVNEHDGFYLHMHFGIGYTRVHGADSAGNDVVLRGVGPSFAIALGGAMTRNLVLFGEVFTAGASNPEVLRGGTSTGNSSGDAQVGGLGFGVAYYIDPANVYFLGSIGLVTFELHDSANFTTYRSEDGIGFHGTIGKEWWVSPNWGLGIAGEFVGASLKDKANPSVTWTGTSFSLLFSTTYN